MYPFATAREISLEVFPVDYPRPSVHTIRRRLCKNFGLRSRKPAKKPRLSPKNIRDRIDFCNKYRNWTAQGWEKVMFSDETTIEQFGQRISSVRRPVGQCNGITQNTSYKQ